MSDVQVPPMSGEIELVDEYGAITVKVKLRDNGDLALEIKPQANQDLVIRDAYLRGQNAKKILLLRRVMR